MTSEVTQTLVQATQTLTIQEKLKSTPDLIIGKTPFKLDPCELSDEYKKRAIDELRETPQNVELGLRVLREKLKGTSILSSSFHAFSFSCLFNFCI